MKTLLYCNRPSDGARKLAEGLGIKRARETGRELRPTPGALLLNWGASSLPLRMSRLLAEKRIVNVPGAVMGATNKLLTYQWLSHHPEVAPFVPWFTDSKLDAISWLGQNQGRTLLCRTVLNGSGGVGITEASDGGDVIDAPLYVEYVAKKEEYRVHVFTSPAGVAVFPQQKKRRLATPDHEVDWRIRNHRGGFIYAHHDVRLPDPVFDAATRAVPAIGLHFGAVDIGWNEKHQRATIYEINTAPGLEGETLRKYVEYFRFMMS